MGNNSKFLQLKALTVINVLFLITILLLGSAKTTQASSIIFQDDFNDGNADGWQVEYFKNCDISNTNWLVEDFKYGVEINSGDCWTHSHPGHNIIPPDIEYVFEVDISFPENTDEDRNIIFKHKDLSNRYGLHLIGNKIIYERIVNGEVIRPPHGNSYTYDFQPNHEYHFKFEVRKEVVTIHIHNKLGGNEKTIEIPEPDSSFPNDTFALRATTGAIAHSKVLFDNIVVRKIEPVMGPFELPFDYPDRLNSGGEQFRDAFWGRLTAVFDHYRRGGKHIPFTGDEYKRKDCRKGSIGVQCYDSHNGTDFDDFDRNNNISDPQKVLSVADGKVVYRSVKDKRGKCEKGGFGCVVIVRYETGNVAGTVYGLYAHLSEINPDIPESASSNNPQGIEITDKIGIMGDTGCSPRCGTHLHFGVMKPVGVSNTSGIQIMTR